MDTQCIVHFQKQSSCYLNVKQVLHNDNKTFSKSKQNVLELLCNLGPRESDAPKATKLFDILE